MHDHRFSPCPRLWLVQVLVEASDIRAGQIRSPSQPLHYLKSFEVMYCGYCPYSQVFRGPILRVLPVLRGLYCSYSRYSQYLAFRTSYTPSTRSIRPPVPQYSPYLECERYSNSRGYSEYAHWEHLWNLSRQTHPCFLSSALSTVDTDMCLPSRICMARVFRKCLPGEIFVWCSSCTI